MNDVHIKGAVFDLDKILACQKGVFRFHINFETNLSQGADAASGVIRAPRREQIKIQSGSRIPKKNGS